MLNSVKWEYFKLEDLFKIERGRSLPMKDQEYGDIPIVSSTEQNNGVSNKVKKSSENKLFQRNSITLAINGSVGECFHQPHDFFATGDVAVLKLKYGCTNEYINLFLVTVLRLEKQRYSYGRKWTMTRIKSTSIKLPVDSNGDPNWNFMEDYMKKISKGNLEGFNLPKNDTRLSLDDREWDEFKLEDLFEIKASKNNNKSIIEDCISKDRENIIAYITRSTRNNGVNFFANSLKLRESNIPIYEGNCIIVGIESSTAFYINNNFVTGTNITRLYHKNINSFNGLFIIKIINKDMFRYSYSRGLTLGRLKNTIIKLPIKPKSSPDEKSEPDWEFMENYIKGLPYTNKL